MEQLLGSLPGAISQGLIWGIMAIGLYITYKILAISDLTVDGTIILGEAVCAVLITSGVNPWVAMLCATAAGALAGLVTGLLHTVLDIPAILSGILTQMMLWSIYLKVTDGQANVSLNPRKYQLVLTTGDSLNVILTLLAILAVIIGILYWFFGTELGCSIRATGCNNNMARAQGINTEFNKVLGLVISNAIVALSGSLLAQYQSAADINAGKGAIVIGLAAIVIGDVVMQKVARNFAVRLCGVLVGGVIYYMIYQIIVFIGIDTDLLKMLSAVVVVIFLGVPNLRAEYFSGIHAKTKKKAGENNA